MKGKEAGEETMAEDMVVGEEIHSMLATSLEFPGKVERRLSWPRNMANVHAALPCTVSEEDEGEEELPPAPV